jgi:hypothetical protein
VEYLEAAMKQREMPFFKEVGEPKLLSESLISRLRSEHDALVLCWAKRQVKYSQAAGAALLGIPPSHFSNILSGQKYPPYDMRMKLQALCGNWAIRQYEDMVIGARTEFETPEERELRVLRSRVNELEQAIAA